MSNDELNNEKYKYEGQVEDILDYHCDRLEQKHPLERKIKFLLDIRGYLKVNKIKGSYFEFGCFEAKTMYCAHKILECTSLINDYVGLDTFEGEPKMSMTENRLIPFVNEGSFASNIESVQSFVDKNIGKKGHLVQGDFRKKEIIEKCDKFGPISVAFVDCNILSSISSSLEYILKNIVHGGIIFIDDYYTNFAEGKANVNDLVLSKFKSSNFELIEHGFYYPFGRSFIVTTKT